MLQGSAQNSEWHSFSFSCIINFGDWAKQLNTIIGTPSFVSIRGKSWLVEDVIGEANDIQTLRLSCISDDAQGERLDVLWDAEIGAVELDTDSWRNIGTGLPDKAEVLAAHLRAIRWRSATAADRDLLQAPFRAGMAGTIWPTLPHPNSSNKMRMKAKRQKPASTGQPPSKTKS